VSKNQIESAGLAAADTVFLEMKEREDKKLNLIVHGLTELGANTKSGMERKNIDSSNFKRMLESVNLNIDVQSDIKFLVRLGDHNKQNSKPRPLLLGFRNNEIREKILESSKQLSTIPGYEEASIVPDLTKRQRTEEQEMRVKATKLNSEMSEEDSLNWIWSLMGPRGYKRLVKLRKTQREGQNRPWGERGRRSTLGHGRHHQE